MHLMLQRALSDEIALRLDTFKAKHQLEPQQLLYWLVSFTWGHAMRLGWDTRRLAAYCLKTFEACEQTRASSLHGDIQPPAPLVKL
jgi:hypothetical protein